MQTTLRPVPLEGREILANLLEKYSYEFSQYDRRDTNKLGLYGYKYLDSYWTEDKRWAYFIEADGQLAGFVMVNTFSEVEGAEIDFQIAEFFVMFKYRRLGVGKQAFFEVLRRHKGRWQLRLHPKNTASVHFWRNAIGEYTNGRYTFMAAHPDCGYGDGTPGDVYFFES